MRYFQRPSGSNFRAIREEIDQTRRGLILSPLLEPDNALRRILRAAFGAVLEPIGEPFGELWDALKAIFGYINQAGGILHCPLSGSHKFIRGVLWDALGAPLWEASRRVLIRLSKTFHSADLGLWGPLGNPSRRY